ncbi:hypothetical protein BC830DRAFT_1102539 [Chytriomyces sp. MP71]|nr:hypothetical protein BC830DRAFT_1102539 [Chytriomyces sp. MP71]
MGTKDAPQPMPAPATARISIAIPFATRRHASIAAQVLSADRNPKDTTMAFAVADGDDARDLIMFVALTARMQSTLTTTKFLVLTNKCRTIESRDAKLLRTAVSSRLSHFPFCLMNTARGTGYIDFGGKIEVLRLDSMNCLEEVGMDALSMWRKSS